jgi:hypothetical protein
MTQSLPALLPAGFFHSAQHKTIWVWLFYIIANLFVFKAYKQIIINKIIAI